MYRRLKAQEWSSPRRALYDRPTSARVRVRVSDTVNLDDDRDSQTDLHAPASILAVLT